MNKVLFSKKSDYWNTPDDLYFLYMDNGYFDPCPSFPMFNGLEIEWRNKNFVNPPYSNIRLWVDKAIEEHKKGKEVILLIPARTDTKYFRKLVDYGVDISFITGRLHFNNSGSAPFPSCLIKLTNSLTMCNWIDVLKDSDKE